MPFTFSIAVLRVLPAYCVLQVSPLLIPVLLLVWNTGSDFKILQLLSFLRREQFPILNFKLIFLSSLNTFRIRTIELF